MTDYKKEIKRRMIHPAVDIRPGVYSFGKLEDLSPKTYDQTVMMLEMLHFDVERGLEIELTYHKAPIGYILENDSTYAGPLFGTIEKYAPEARFREIPSYALENLSKDLGVTVRHIQASVNNVRDIYRRIMRTEEYYPPVLLSEPVLGQLILDGTHRVVALALILVRGEKIYAWQMTENPPKEYYAR